MKKILAIDMGGTKVKYSYIGIDGSFVDPIFECNSPTNEFEYLEAVNQIIEDCGQPFSGIAISTTGIVDPQSGNYIKSGNFPFMEGKGLKLELQRRLNLPVTIINDGYAAMLGEIWVGGLRNVTNAIILTLGTAVGGGILINGQPYFGSNRKAGEFSFLTHKIESPIFPALHSAQFLIKSISHEISQGELLSGEEVFELIHNGHQVATDIFNKYCFDLALFIFNLQTCFDPEKIIIAGGISQQEILIANIKENYQLIYEKRALRDLGPSIMKIEETKLSAYGHLLGATYYLIQEGRENYGKETFRM